jgi:hypothetical protein
LRGEDVLVVMTRGLLARVFVVHHEVVVFLFVGISVADVVLITMVVMG